MDTCRLKEPAVPFKTVAAVTYTYHDGSSELKPSHADIGLVSVDAKLLSKDAFATLYSVDAPTLPLV